MKSIFTLLFTAALSLSIFAQPQSRGTKLTVSTTGNMPVRVMVDNNKYSSGNGQDVTVRNLTTGFHTVKIFIRRSGRGFGNGQGNNGYQNGYQQVYSSQVYIKVNTHTDITVNRFGKAYVDEQQMGNGYYDEDDEDWGDNGNWNGNGNGNGNGNWGGYQQQAMDSKVFDQFKQTLRNEGFDDTRANLAKQTISANYFTVAQVKEILGLFSFESTKLSVAKYAYDYTIDKGSYFLVNDVFSFSSSKDELANYIRAKK